MKLFPFFWSSKFHISCHFSYTMVFPRTVAEVRKTDTLKTPTIEQFCWNQKHEIYFYYTCKRIFLLLVTIFVFKNYNIYILLMWENVTSLWLYTLIFTSVCDRTHKQVYLAFKWTLACSFANFIFSLYIIMLPAVVSTTKTRPYYYSLAHNLTKTIYVHKEMT